MNLLLLAIFATVCAGAVESRYPYEDTYTTGDVVPPAISSRLPYDRESGRYPRKERGGGLYGGILGSRRNNRYGKRRQEDHLYRDYRRRYRDYDTYLPPRGIGGGYYNKPYDRPDYDYGRNNKRPRVTGPTMYYDEEDVDYGGYYNKRPSFGLGPRYN